MPKPSIFSKNYDESMKKRKRLKIFSIVLVVIIVIVSGIYLIGRKPSKIEIKNKNISTNNNTKSNKEDIKESNVKKNEKQKDYKKQEVKSSGYEVKFINGEQVTVLYDVIDNKKQFTGIDKSELSHDISPSKNYVVILDNNTQSMILIDINGNIKDITKIDYESSKGEVFKKDNILKSNEKYIWCNYPKFMDDNNIVFMSQLPWFNKENTKYLWKYTISSNQYQHNLAPEGGEIFGSDIKYGKITSEGLEVIFDGATKIVK